VSRDIRVSDDPAAEVAERLTEAAIAGGDVVLTGGSTPKRAYELAAERDADWSAAHVWFTDERCVEPTHPDANFAMADRALLSQLSAAPTVHRMEAELGPDAGAGSYEAEIRGRMAAEPRWNLLLLGMGPDGHVASLFPEHPSSYADGRVIPVRSAPKPPPERISLTLEVINSAAEVWFCVTGADKAAAARLALSGAGPLQIPAAGVQARERTLWLLDREAAAELPPDSGSRGVL
jgi:6-phosphogluconolactonase